MTMSDYGSSPIVSNVGELVSKVATIVGSTNMKHWFRGHHSADWSLEPSIHRIKENPELIGVTERDFMHTFRSRAGVRYKDTPEFDDIAGWISLMQHYGLPTRLLDWSRSPLIAAYFALERYLI